MAIEVPVSRLLIMCTQPPGSERPDPEVLRHVLEIGRLTQPLAKEGIETSIITGETRDFAEDFLFQKVRKPFSLVYLSGTMPEKGSLIFPARGGGLTRIDETDLGRTLAAIPEVQMVFLSGMASPELVRTLLLAGVPAVLSLGQEEGATLFADEYFFQLIQGKTLRQAFFDAQEGLGFRIPLHEASYDPEREILTWSDKHEPDLGFGLTVRVHKIRALSWRLRNPLAITPAERESWKSRSYPNQTPNEHSQKGSRLRNRIRKEDADPELYTSQTRTPVKDETRTVRQRPTRSNQTEAREEEPAPVPRKKYGRIAAALFAIAITLTGLSFVPQVRTIFGNLFKPQEPEALCPFPQGDGKYHVLVLPFNSKPGCTEIYPQFRRDLTDRISRMEKTEGLAVSVRTVNLIDCAEGGESLREMAVSCQADLVVWGLIQKDTFSGKETLELRYVAMSDAGEQSFLSGAGLNLRSPLDEPGILSAQISTQTTQLLRWALGCGQMNEGKYAEAIRLFEGISTEKREIDNLVSSMIARCYVRAGQFERARAVYDTKVSAYPNDPNVYIDRAQILIETGDTLSALVDFDFALQLDPANISAIIGRGNLYSSLGKFEEALTDFDRVIAMNPDFAPVYCRRAELFISTGKTSAALSDLDRAIGLQPGYADAWFLRGKLRYENKQEAAGIADIDRALQITPEHPEAVKLRADIHLARQEWSQAAEVYTRLLARRRSPEVFHQRGLLYLKINRNAEAIADFTRAIELKPSMENAWYARAQAYLQQHSSELALADYRHLCEEFPDRAENWRLQGEVLMQLERFSEAETALNQAISLDGNHAVAWSMRGLARFRQGKTDEA
ncbi:MAG: tetratricopeptide repeat protein, partial [Bacteroidetes bacterium]